MLSESSKTPFKTFNTTSACRSITNIIASANTLNAHLQARDYKIEVDVVDTIVGCGVKDIKGDITPKIQYPV